MIFTAQTAIFFGIYSYSVNHEFETNLYWYGAILFLGSLIILEAFHQDFLAREKLAFNEPVNEMTIDKFNAEI